MVTLTPNSAKNASKIEEISKFSAMHCPYTYETQNRCDLTGF